MEGLQGQSRGDAGDVLFVILDEFLLERRMTRRRLHAVSSESEFCRRQAPNQSTLYFYGAQTFIDRFKSRNYKSVTRLGYMVPAQVQVGLVVVCQTSSRAGTSGFGNGRLLTRSCHLSRSNIK
jgi:hypothetical protein